jgi:hypothetical protein
MNASKRGIYFAVTIFVLTLALVGSAMWSAQPDDVQAEIAQNEKGFLPVVISNNQIDPPASPTPTFTPSATSTPTQTPTNTPTPTPTLTPTPPVDPPVIESFSAAPALIVQDQNQASALKWTVTGEDIISMYINADPGPDVGPVDGLDKMTVKPLVTTNYELVVENAYGAVVTDMTTVKVVDALPEGEQGAFDWDRSITQAMKGFATQKARRLPNNNDWTTPIDYAGGKVYLRVIVRNQPVGQDMKLQWCAKQKLDGDASERENCVRPQAVDASSGAYPVTVTWATSLSNLWKKNGIAIDWSQPRESMSVVVKNENGCPVSDWAFYADDLPNACPVDENERMLPWAGEIPEDYYDLDVRMTVIVVANGEKFSGWDNYPD